MDKEILNIKKKAMKGMKEDKKDQDFLRVIYDIADVLEYCHNCSSNKSDSFYSYDKKSISEKLKRISSNLKYDI